MRQSFFGMFACSLLTVAVLASACGSDDDKKKTRVDRPGSAGEGGEGAATSSGGSSTSEAGQGGAEPVGTSGSGNIDPSAGAPGDDAAGGTADAPFETLAHAASIAQAGDTIVFLDGAYTLTTTIPIPAGVNLMAENAGSATVNGSGFNARLRLGGDTRLIGLEIANFSTAIDFAGAATASGTLSIEDTKFTACGSACLLLSGTVKAVATVPAGVVLSNGGQRFASLEQTSTLSIEGGVMQNHGNAGIIQANDESQVTLTDVEVLDGTGLVLSLREESVGTVTGLTAATLGQVLFEQPNGSESQLTVIDSDLSIKPNATAYHCFLVYEPSKLSISGSKLHGCGTGIKGGVPVELTLTDTEFYDLTFGADLDTGGPNPGGKVRIDGCDIRDVEYTGMRMGGGTSVLDLKIRNTVFDVTSLVGWGGLIIAAGNAATIDLGTLADPGGNTFIQRNVTNNSTALRLNMQAITVQAVGNTWTPSLQGADAQGLYAVKTGKVLEDATAVNAGTNYIKPYATTTLRLAQIP